jgi:hypothetical protein
MVGFNFMWEESRYGQLRDETLRNQNLEGADIITGWSVGSSGFRRNDLDHPFMPQVEGHHQNAESCKADACKGLDFQDSPSRVLLQFELGGPSH